MAKKESKPKAPAAPTQDSELQAILQALQSSGSGTTLTPIGQLPTGYQQDPTATKETRGVVRYFKGDERLPAALTGRAVEDIQTKLFHAGILQDDFIKGTWDPRTEAAYESLLSYANATGLDKDDALLAYQMGTPMEIDPKTGKPRARKGGLGGTKTAPLTISYSNPNSIAEAANEIARKRIGRSFNGEELSRFVAAFNQEEARAQGGAYGIAEGGGAVTEAEGVATMAARFADTTDPMAAQANRMMDYTEAINGMLGGLGFQTAKPGTGA